MNHFECLERPLTEQSKVCVSALFSILVFIALELLGASKVSAAELEVNSTDQIHSQTAVPPTNSLTNGVFLGSNETASVDAQQDLLPHLYYLLDAQGNLTAEDVMRPEMAERFMPLIQYKRYFDFSYKVIWLRFRLSPASASTTPWIVEVNSPGLDLVDIHEVYAGAVQRVVLGGDMRPFGLGDIRHRRYNASLRLPAGQQTEVLIRVANNGALRLPTALLSQQAFAEQDHQEQMLLGIYLGVMVSMLLYNAVFYFGVRDKAYLYYVLYIGALTLSLMGQKGLTAEYLWPNWPYWANRAPTFFLFMSAIGVGLFTRTFLDLPRHAPNLDRWMRWGLVNTSAFMLAPAVWAPHSWVIAAASITAMFSALSVMVIAGICVWRRLPLAKYFAVAWSTIAISAAAIALRQMGILTDSLLLNNAMEIGSSIEVLLLGTALAYRMQLLKQENERIHREANELLDQRVKERTEALDAAMIQLTESSEQLKALNRTDALTNLYNRRFFNESLTTEWRRSARTGKPVALIMLDIDFFKSVNDKYGHPGGDACLQTISHQVLCCVKRPADLCFRYGGEEFAVLLPETDVAGAMVLAESIRAQISKEIIVFQGQSFTVTASLGIAVAYPMNQPVDTETLLVNLADAALYEAKKTGRNRVVVNPNSST